MITFKENGHKFNLAITNLFINIDNVLANSMSLPC